MIVVWEPVCWGMEHSPVNAAVLEIMLVAFSDETIRFCAEQDHLLGVLKQMRRRCAARIEGVRTVIPARRASFLGRIVKEILFLRRVFRWLARGGRPGLLFLTSCTPSTLVAVKILLALSRRKHSAQVVLHGILSTLVGWRSRNPLVRIQDLRSALSLGDAGNVQYLVLEEPIKKKVVELLPGLRERVEVLEHPVCPGEGDDVVIEIPPLPLKLAFLGLATEEKGFLVFLDLAWHIRERFGGAAEFHAIGEISPEVAMWVREGRIDLRVLSSKPVLEKVPRETYTHLLREMHYVCLPYRSHYDLSASGTLADAIAWCKPLIATPTPTLEHLFGSSPGIGYLCRSGRDLFLTLSRLVESFDADLYSAQIAALLQLRQSRLPAALARSYMDYTARLFRSTGNRCHKVDDSSMRMRC